MLRTPLLFLVDGEAFGVFDHGDKARDHFAALGHGPIACCPRVYVYPRADIVAAVVVKVVLVVGCCCCLITYWHSFWVVLVYCSIPEIEKNILKNQFSTRKSPVSA